ncbi:homocysteine S-methyltransferase family protein [Clostridium sp. CX1]|uniref:homocysteine S-methyltransferase family protein n=1 Tax=Clostridium sp. CX1 TaxID=2978346 RepID=UPI0021C122FB|nr:homocysteine S-methyltransferase family protein [Clostridium sp. CX1]MCT8977954.1 homocysteine S-methyltransferase family protein [Clostridium sp. CX1]
MSLKDRFMFFDGAMGTMLQREGLKVGELPESLNITNPDIIRKIHRQYIEAGSDVVITNTFGANELKYSKSQFLIEEVITAGVKVAREAAADKLVALDIGPIGQIMEPTGSLSFEGAYELFKKQVIIGEKAGADLILIETMSDLYETKAAILAAKENSSLPVFCTMTFQENGRTLMGTDPKTMVFVLEGLGVDALGVNCSLGPKELMPIVEEILKYSSIPVMVQPNAGLPRYDGEKTIYDIAPEQFAEYIKTMAEKGVRIFGGCCGTNPDYIKASVKILQGLKPADTKPKNYTAVCSATETVILDGSVKIIGERINPTGKARYKEELKEKSVKYIQAEAVKQKEEGADILGLNVGLPEIDEKEMMTKAVKAIQKVVQLPVTIDSPTPEVLEAGARVYNGKPIINSVNGKESTMEKVFPIVKKYGGAVIALTIDEKGIPATAEERVKIAEKILKRAKDYGIDKKDIIIDCLALTASAQQKDVLETVRAIKLVKEKLGVKTVLGVSNISYGLPNRKLLNRTFLSMALYAGLDLPITNTGDEEIKATINAFEVLSNIDKESKNYISKYGKAGTKVNQLNKEESNFEVKNNNLDKDLKEIIIAGIEEDAVQCTKELLKVKEPIEIVNSYIIPALDFVGEEYESGEIFLPQLIQSAETVKRSFEVIKKSILTSGTSNIEKGKIVVATVKGDIHDIGKNIVKVLLENYGFEVIDLGKDVPIEEVVRVVKENNIKLVGLSALMTTTVANMKKTIEALKESGADCKVMVGGAVLNKEYAEMIGADFYARDARESVKIAEEVFGK